MLTGPIIPERVLPMCALRSDSPLLHMVSHEILVTLLVTLLGFSTVVGAARIIQYSVICQGYGVGRQRKFVFHTGARDRHGLRGLSLV